MPVEEGTAKSNAFIVVNLTPDICLSPTAPIPYNIIAFLSDAVNTSEAQKGEDVRFQSKFAFNMKSRVSRSFGDHPGVGLGLGSAAVQGWCRPLTPVVTVRCNGVELCRHDHTKFEMNCLGPEGPGNTIGKVIYLGVMLPGSVSADGKVPDNANPPLDADTPQEPSFLDKIKDSLKVESIKDAVDLAKQGYELTKVDWSDPSAAVDALAGMAGRAGLKDVAAAIKLGKKVADADWSKPSEILKSAGDIAGDAFKLGESLYGSLFPKNEEPKDASKVQPNNLVPPNESAKDNGKPLQQNGPPPTALLSSPSDVSSPTNDNTAKPSTPDVADNYTSTPLMTEAEPWRNQLQRQLEDENAQMSYRSPSDKVLADGVVDNNEHLNRNDYNWCPDNKPTGSVAGVDWTEKSGLANYYHSPLACTTGQPTDGSLGQGSFECCYDPKTGDLIPNSGLSGTYNYSHGNGFVIPGIGVPVGAHGRNDVAPHKNDPNYSHVNMTYAPPSNQQPPPDNNSPYFLDLKRTNETRAQRGLPPLQP